MVLRNLRRLYSPDVLDTRFIVPANAPPKEALELADLGPAPPLPAHNGQAKDKREEEEVQPSRWGTLEFNIYVFLVGWIIVFMITTVVNVSKRSSSPIMTLPSLC